MRLTAVAVCLLATSLVQLAVPSDAKAQDYLSVVPKTYKVQVEYWFFDTDYYYWKTVFESTDYDDAKFMYELLLLAKANNQLNQAAPNEYWRYIAVDVRMITEYHFPRYQTAYPQLKLSDAVVDNLHARK